MVDSEEQEASQGRATVVASPWKDYQLHLSRKTKHTFSNLWLAIVCSLKCKEQRKIKEEEEKKEQERKEQDSGQRMT